MSDLGSLSSCMLENDAEARSRARKLRQKALVASIVFEAALVGAMLLWPLITPGVLTGAFIVTPTPPYHGGGDAAERRPHSDAHPPASTTHTQPVCVTCAPPSVPDHVRAMSNDGASASIDNAPGIGDGGMDGPPGNGSIIPEEWRCKAADGDPQAQSSITPRAAAHERSVMEAALI